MKCERCGGGMYVAHMRYKQNQIIRIRKCPECGALAFTKEITITDEEGRTLFRLPQNHKV